MTTDASNVGNVDDHLDVDTVADLIENLLPATEAHRARNHVKACPDCQRTYDALVELSADLAEEGRADITMPQHVAEHLDAVIRSESVMRQSAVGVHSLAQIREHPSRHVPRLALAAASALVVAAAGVSVILSTTNGSDPSAGFENPSGSPSAPPSMTTAEVAATVQKQLEGSTEPVLRAGADEQRCASEFAARQPNRTLRLVQQAVVDGRRSTVIGLQSGSSHEVRIFVVTGCDARGATGRDGDVAYVTTVTLRNR
ncbi:MAG TPA: hypothetical protein VGJ44_23975 [Kribbellaceae bacterium]|jgi:hypothetical protein